MLMPVKPIGLEEGVVIALATSGLFSCFPTSLFFGNTALVSPIDPLVTMPVLLPTSVPSVLVSKASKTQHRLHLWWPGPGTNFLVPVRLIVSLVICPKTQRTVF